MTPRDPGQFPDLDDRMIECLERAGETAVFADGAIVFRQGDEADSFHVVLAGAIRVTREIGGGEMLLVEHGPRQFTGELALLTGGLNVATGRAVGETRALHVRREDLPRAISVCPEMLSLVLPALASRNRPVSAMERQSEKLAALGVLAAGLAHELNNPAAAVQSGAQAVRERLRAMRETAADLARTGLTAEALEAVRTLSDRCASHPPDGPLDALARSEREDAVAERLEDIGLAEPWEVAAPLVDAGMTPEDVETLVGRLPCEAVGPALAWLAAALSAEAVARDVEEAGGRISELVRSVKEYSHMDGTSVADVDVRAGIRSTITMMGQAIRDARATVRTELAEVPRVSGYPGELNQVWTNLLHNALDAAPGGEVVVRATPDGNGVAVEVQDSGPGVPDEIRARIFDPFFTTKGVGEGTGLGLDVVRRIVENRHRGRIELESAPGRTVFRVCLPP